MLGARARARLASSAAATAEPACSAKASAAASRPPSAAFMARGAWQPRYGRPARRGLSPGLSASLRCWSTRQAEGKLRQPAATFQQPGVMLLDSALSPCDRELRASPTSQSLSFFSPERRRRAASSEAPASLSGLKVRLQPPCEPAGRAPGQPGPLRQRPPQRSEALAARQALQARASQAAALGNGATRARRALPRQRRGGALRSEGRPCAGRTRQASRIAPLSSRPRRRGR